MKILVTGGNGFLGSRIAKALIDKGHEVCSVQRSDPAVITRLDGVTYLQGDLSDKTSMMPHFEGVEAVFHVAALAGVWGPWDEFYSANVHATENVLEACHRNNIKKLVYTSTPSVVFTGESISGLNEEAGYGMNWLCHYAHTKSIAEEKVLSSETASYLDAVALRPHLIWGDGDPHLFPRIVARARDEKLKIVGNGENKVDLTHVDNATHGHLLAFEKLLSEPDQVARKAYFLSDDSPVKIWNWLNDLLERLDIPVVKKKVPFKLVYFIGYMLESYFQTFNLEGEPAMTRFVATELAKDHYFDIRAAKRDLGYSSIIDENEKIDRLVEYLNEL